MLELFSNKWFRCICYREDVKRVASVFPMEAVLDFITSIDLQVSLLKIVNQMIER